MAPAHAPFGDFISAIVGGCPEKEMLYIDARRIIAPVQDMKIAGRTLFLFPNIPMGKLGATIFTANYAIATSIAGALPFNATSPCGGRALIEFVSNLPGGGHVILR